VVAGALGNTADRLMLGFVRDFLVLAPRPHDIFNLADVLMLAGAASLALSWATRRIAAAGHVLRTSRQESGRDAPPAQV
jgi:lipoprotein signal peptidase